jgi:hypothetical protein
MRIDAADRRAAQSAEARVAAARISASGQGQGGGRILTGDEAKAAGLDPGGRYWIDGRTGKPTVVQAPQSADPVQARADREVGAAQAGLANEALNFAADFTGRSVDELRALSPDQLEKVITEGGRFMTGPVFGRVLGADSLFNSDLVASTESAAARQARINNPTGPIANADMDAARRQVWAPERPAEVNARLIRRAVESARGGAAAPAAPSNVDALLEKYQ